MALHAFSLRGRRAYDWSGCDRVDRFFSMPCAMTISRYLLALMLFSGSSVPHLGLRFHGTAFFQVERNPLPAKDGGRALISSRAWRRPRTFLPKMMKPPRGEDGRWIG